MQIPKKRTAAEAIAMPAEKAATDQAAGTRHKLKAEAKGEQQQRRASKRLVQSYEKNKKLEQEKREQEAGNYGTGHIPVMLAH